MWVYQVFTREQQECYVVGYYAPPTDSRRNPDYRWVGMQECDTEAEAVQTVHYLNGGSR
jgi:hypothetical protein